LSLTLWLDNDKIRRSTPDRAELVEFCCQQINYEQHHSIDCWPGRSIDHREHRTRYLDPLPVLELDSSGNFCDRPTQQSPVQLHLRSKYSMWCTYCPDSCVSDRLKDGNRSTKSCVSLHGASQLDHRTIPDPGPYRWTDGAYRRVASISVRVGAGSRVTRT
jgi:hypothetical protein